MICFVEKQSSPVHEKCTGSMDEDETIIFVI